MKGRVRVEQLLDEVEWQVGASEADELRAYVVTSSHALVDAGDDETTEWTGDAKAEAWRILAPAVASTAQFVEVGGELILLEVVGQVPDRKAYRQGMRPERLRFLLRMERIHHVPVLLAFYHGTWELAWLSTLPDPDNIVLKQNGDRDTARVGWYAGEDEEAGVFWVSETFDLDSFPPHELPRPTEWAAARLTDGLG